MDIYDHVFQQGFGLVNLGNHRGLFYTSEDHAVGCPRGWLLANPKFTESAQQLRELVAEYKIIIREFETKAKE